MTPNPEGSSAARTRFMESLPWYLNGWLPEYEREEMDALIATEGWARTALDREQALAAAVYLRARQVDVPQDLGLQALMSRVDPRVTAAPSSTWQRLWSWWTAPHLAGAAMAVVLAQSGVIGWMVSQDEASHPAPMVRGGGPQVPWTVVFVPRPGLSEAELRAALLRVGADIVGGPNQLGEYRVWSSVSSRAEVEAAVTGLQGPSPAVSR